MFDCCACIHTTAVWMIYQTNGQKTYDLRGDTNWTSHREEHVEDGGGGDGVMCQTTIG